MNVYKVKYWTVVEAESEQAAKEIFIELLDENSIEVELLETTPPLSMRQ